MMFEDYIMIIFCIYFFSMHFSRICHLYRDAAGLWWQDRFRPIVETVVNLVLNILLVKYLGVTGVMLSTIFCIVGIEGTWGTRILFKYYFSEEKMSVYMLKLLWSWLLTAGSGAIVYFICRAIPMQGIPAILVYGIIGSAVSVVIYILGNVFMPEFKPAVAFALKLIGLNKVAKKLKLVAPAPAPVETTENAETTENVETVDSANKKE